MSNDTKESDRVVTITVPREVPSLNTFMRQHWAVRRVKRNDWRFAVWFGLDHRVALGLRAYVAHGRKMRVEIISERKKLLDQDNICVKHVLDALVYAGFILDDSPEHIELVVTQRKSNERQTVIKISEAR